MTKCAIPLQISMSIRWKVTRMVSSCVYDSLHTITLHGGHDIGLSVFPVYMVPCVLTSREFVNCWVGVYFLCEVKEVRIENRSEKKYWIEKIGLRCIVCMMMEEAEQLFVSSGSMESREQPLGRQEMHWGWNLHRTQLRSASEFNL